jgi:hypothetical protein
MRRRGDLALAVAATRNATEAACATANGATTEGSAGTVATTMTTASTAAGLEIIASTVSATGPPGAARKATADASINMAMVTSWHCRPSSSRTHRHRSTMLLPHQRSCSSLMRW